MSRERSSEGALGARLMDHGLRSHRPRHEKSKKTAVLIGQIDGRQGLSLQYLFKMVKGPPKPATCIVADVAHLGDMVFAMIAFRREANRGDFFYYLPHWMQYLTELKHAPRSYGPW